MHPSAPRPPAVKPDWRKRLASLRNIRPLLALVWETSPALTVASVLLRLCRAAIPVLALWVPKLIIDAVVAAIRGEKADPWRIWQLVALEFGIAILGDVLSRATNLCDSLLGDRFTNRISIRLMRHAALMDLTMFEDPVFYDKLERARRQTTGRLGLLASTLNLLQETISLLFLSAALLAFAPWLMALLAVAVLPSFFGEAHFTNLAYSMLYRSTPQRRELDYLRMLGASNQSAKEVKIFGLGGYLADRYQRISIQFEADNRRLAVRRASLGTLLNLLATGGYYGAYVLTLARTLSGALSLGSFTFLSGSFARSRSAIERILSGFTDISEQALFLNDLFDFFALKPEIHSRPGALSGPRPVRKGFEFRDVTFNYPGSSKPVIQNINFVLEAQEKIALIGENGAGKTTLVKLLARLYDPTSGQILLDGVDLRDYDVEDLRKEIGVIFQDYMRYEMLARENIGLGRVDHLCDTDAITVAADKSLAAGVIGRLPLGLDQMLGRRFEGGVDLSGGEWQKFALARAYMRDAQLLILDEPTATLDARAEYEVFQRFADLTRGRMAVLISHRFSTVRMADRILVLAGGAIQEHGTHQQLISLGGRYAELFELQAAGYR